jgi:hypothetical protein
VLDDLPIPDPVDDYALDRDVVPCGGNSEMVARVLPLAAIRVMTLSPSAIWSRMTWRPGVARRKISPHS